MCGINGIFTTRPQPDLAASVSQMNQLLTHRGPDGEGVWSSSDHALCLGHRRLSIIDLSENANQPMVHQDGHLVLVFNGEIYNHVSLRQELTKRGHVFQTDHCDSEVILYGYCEWGQAVVERLEGMFAFAIWDDKSKELFLARDRIGIKPLYYHLGAEGLVFSSEIKSLFAATTIQKELNEEALCHYLSFVAVPSPLTLFKGVYKLPPAHCLFIKKDFQPQVTRYYDPLLAASQREVPAYDEAKSKVLSLLKSSIHKRMMSDVPYGVFLSGGVDSSANVALMSELKDEPVRTFSVGFEDDEQSEFNEMQYARQIAKKFGTEHHETLLNEQHFFDFFEEMPFYQDEPLADPVCVPLYYVSKLAKDQGVTVIQVGEGSDEIFSGYSFWVKLYQFYRYFWQPYQKVPKLFRKLAYHSLMPFLNSHKLEYFRKAAHNQELFWSGAVFINETDKKKLLKAPYNSLYNSYSVVQKNLEGLAELKSPVNILNQMAYTDLKHRLPELLLMRVDKMTMANSQEARVPFLDHELVEFALSLPVHYKTDGRVGKKILKECLEGVLPPEIICRKKIGFCGSVQNMLTKKIHNHAKDLILNQAKGLQHWIDKDYVLGLLSSYDDRHKSQVWSLMNLALWWRQWFEKS